MPSKIIITESQLKNIITETSYNVNWSKYPCVTSNKGLTQSKDSEGNIIYINKTDQSTYYGNGKLVISGLLGGSFDFSCIDGKISSRGIKGSEPSSKFLSDTGKKDAEQWKKPEISCVLQQQGLKSMLLNNGSVAYVFNNMRYYSNGLTKTNSSGDGVVGYFKCVNGKPTATSRPQKIQPTTEKTYNGGELKTVNIQTKPKPKQSNDLLTQKTKQIQKMVGMTKQTGIFGNVTLGNVISKIGGTLSEQGFGSDMPTQSLTPADTTVGYVTKDSELKTNVNIPKPATIKPIEDLQTMLNTKYKSGLVVDGKYGIKTANAIIKALGTKPLNEDIITQLINKCLKYKQ